MAQRRTLRTPEFYHTRYQYIIEALRSGSASRLSLEELYNDFLVQHNFYPRPNGLCSFRQCFNRYRRRYFASSSASAGTDSPGLPTTATPANEYGSNALLLLRLRLAHAMCDRYLQDRIRLHLHKSQEARMARRDEALRIRARGGLSRAATIHPAATAPARGTPPEPDTARAHPRGRPWVPPLPSSPVLSTARPQR